MGIQQGNFIQGLMTWGLVLLCAFFSACAPALPSKTLSNEVGDRALAAGQSAKFAHQAADRAEEQLVETRRLHAEAIQMLEQAKSIEKYCKDLRAKIPKQRVVYIEKKKKKKPAEGGDSGEQDEEEEEENDAPKYSPSDAPLKK